jgi:hypothetical protein
MTDERNPEELSDEEVEGANAEPLPDREAMSILKPPMPVPVETLPPFYTIDPPPPEEM